MSQVEDYRFEVALSFAGDNKRDKVRAVARILSAELGPGCVFFDEWFEAEIAGNDAQVLLQKFYGEKTRVVVACVCQRYNEKPWPKAEWRAIQALEFECQDAGTANLKRMRFLQLRFGDGDVDGLFKTAFVPDVRDREPRAIADLILERLRLARGEPSVNRGGGRPPPTTRPAGPNDAPPTPWAVDAGTNGPSRNVQDLSHSRRRPILDIAYRERKWRITNIGNAPALRGVVSESDHPTHEQPNPPWYRPVRIAAVKIGEERVLRWLGRSNAARLGVVYDDEYGVRHSAICHHDNCMHLLGGYLS